MSNPTADDLKAMDFVFGGQPFVRAAVFSGSLTDTRGLDYVSNGTSFSVQTFDEPLSIALSTAPTLGLIPSASLGTAAVVSSTATPLSMSFAGAAPSLQTMSFVWRGRPFVKALGPTVDTKSLDYVGYAAPFVTPFSSSANISVALCSAPNPGFTAKISLSHAAATAAAQDPGLLVFSGVVTDLTGMSYVRRGQPFVNAAGITTYTESLDYVSKAQPFLVVSELTSDISVVAASAPGLILGQNFQINAVAAATASAVNPALLAFAGQDPDLLSTSYVRQGKPFVRAAVFVTETKSLDYVARGVPFVAPDSFDGEIAVCPSTAHDPSLVYSAQLQTTVCQALAIVPGIKYSSEFNPMLGEMSFTWLGQPFVRATSEQNIDTESLDYVYNGASYVAQFPSLAPVQAIAIGAPTVVTGSALSPSLRPHVVVPPSTVVTASAGAASLVYKIKPDTSVVTGSASSPLLVPTVIPQNISIASSSAGSVTLSPSLFISASTAGASAINPNLIASIIPSNITAITSSAGSVTLLPTVALPASHASALAVDPSLLSSIVPQGVTVVTASAGSVSLLSAVSPIHANASALAINPNIISFITLSVQSVSSVAVVPSLNASIILQGVASATATAENVFLLPSLTISAAGSLGTAIDLNITAGVSLQAAPSTAFAYTPSLLIATGLSVYLTASVSYAAASSPNLIPDLVLQTTPASASAISPTLAQIYISSPAVATALAGPFAVNPSITVGLPDFGISFYDRVNRAEPLDPSLTAGDLVNRGEPIEFLQAPRGVAIAVAIDPVTEVTDHITIFLGTAPAIASAIPLDLEQAAFPAEEFRRKSAGQSGTKRAQREKEQSVIVAARLVKVNGKPPGKLIESFVRIIGGAEPTSSVSLTEGVTVRVRKPWEDIKIKIARVA